jgi:hypothetical protein
MKIFYGEPGEGAVAENVKIGDPLSLVVSIDEQVCKADYYLSSFLLIFLTAEPKRANVFCFLTSLPLLHPCHHGSAWLLLVISTLSLN